MNKITTKIKQYNRKNIVVSYVFGFFCIIITCILLYNSNRPTDDQSKTPDYSNLGSNPNYGKFSDSVSNNNQNNSTSNTDRDSSQKTYNTQQSLVKINSDNTKTFITESGEVFPLRTYKTLTVNDPSGNQWWTSGTGLNTAWSIGSGSYQTVVAVIDTGFGLKHEEFTNRWATNENEQGVTFNQMPSNLNCSDRVLPLDKSCNLIDDNFDGIVDNETGSTTKENPSKLNCTDLGIELDKSCNLIDDDSNGYIDDVTGWDFANYDANVQAGEINPDGEGTSHGTEVTGILAATGNNNKGIAGIDWSTKILPIQAIDDDSYGNTLTVARAIYYATNRGADIISLSLGTENEDSYLRQAVQYALDNDTIVVAASGNDGCNCISYPAQYPEVIAVGSQSATNTPSNFNSYGNNLDILAPGENITTATWLKTKTTDAYSSGLYGTSLATPYISGLLSLSRSHQPNASWGELSNALLATANHTGLTIDNPTSIQIGSGYAKADSLISRVTTPANLIMRYIFNPIPTIGTLGSNDVFQCYLAGDFPTAPFYEITTTSSTYYTIDTLESIRKTSSGNMVKDLGRACIGLPGDTPSIIKSINLLNEINNFQLYKQPQ